MILTKEIEITLNSANMNHFKSLGYYYNVLFHIFQYLYFLLL